MTIDLALLIILITLATIGGGTLLIGAFWLILYIKHKVLVYRDAIKQVYINEIRIHNLECINEQKMWQEKLKTKRKKK